MKLVALAESPNLEKEIEQFAPALFEATHPYLELIIGDRDVAKKVFEVFLNSKTSEHSYRFTYKICLDDRCIGVTSGMSGSEAIAARQANLFLFLKELKGERRTYFIKQLKAFDGLFVTPQKDEFYLNKVAIFHEHQRKGFAKLALAAWVKKAKDQGFKRIRLEIALENLASLRVAEALHFKFEQTIERAGVSYCTLIHQEVNELLTAQFLNGKPLTQMP